MATPSTTTALFQIIDEYIALVSPIAARDPAAFWANDFNAAGAVTRMRMFVTRFDDATATNIINNELSGGVARLNRTFGTALSAPQFQAPTVTAEAIQQTFFPAPTPAQVAGFGTGVELSELDPALLEAAAVLAPESVAAQFVAEQKAAAPPTPVPLGTPPAPPVGIPVAPRLPSQAAQVGVAQTFAQATESSLVGPVVNPGLPLNTRNVMAIPQEALFVSAETTSLPTSGGPTPSTIAPGINPLFGIRLGGLGTLLGAAAGSLIPGVGTVLGAGLGTALFGGGSIEGQQFVPPGLQFPNVTVGQALPGFGNAFPQFATPGFTGITQQRIPQPGFGPDVGVTQSVLDFLNKFPAFTPFSLLSPLLVLPSSESSTPQL